MCDQLRASARGKVGARRTDLLCFTHAVRADFAFRVLEDRVIAAELRGSLGRLPAFMQNLMQFGDASKSGGDEAQACAAALRVFDDIEAMGRSAQAQWRRVEEIYRAEAARLNVAFD